MFESTRVAHADQAEGLRRLFAPRRARLLPVLTTGAGDASWLARLGEAFAASTSAASSASGSRTVLVDAARVQVAAALGLHARYELLHALEGQCAIDRVQLDAAPGLTVVSAARACERAARLGIGLPATLAPVAESSVDVVLLLLSPALANWLPAGEVLVPVRSSRESVAAAVATIVAATLATAPEAEPGRLAFRLLFLGMDPHAADTLARRLALSIGMRSNARLCEGAVAPTARELARVALAAGGWRLAELSGRSGRQRPQYGEVT